MKAVLSETWQSQSPHQIQSTDMSSLMPSLEARSGEKGAESELRVGVLSGQRARCVPWSSFRKASDRKPVRPL